MPVQDGTEPPPETTVPQLVDAVAARTPEREAIVAGPGRLTYSALADRSQAVARGLASLGTGTGTVVGLLAPNLADWVPAAVGAMRTGARVDAFNTWAKAYDLEFLLRSSTASVLVVATRVRGTDLLAELRTLVPEIDRSEPVRSSRFPHLRHVVVIGDEVPAAALSWSTLVDGHAEGAPVGEPAERTGDDPAFVLYTSGSTTTPKAVPLCHRDLVLNGFHIGERMGLGETDRVWLGSPLFWSYGCANALMATMSHGATLVLEEHFTAAAAAATFAREQVTAAYLLPPMIDALATDAAADVRAVASLRTGLTIGRPDVIDRAVDDLGIDGICNIYGSTETYGNCCVTDHRAPLERRRVTQGRPLPGVEVRIVDDDGALLPPGEPGEAQVRGRLTPGYLGDGAAADAANAAAFTPDGWYRTGDRLMLDDDGAVAFVDRTGDMIKTSGINVSPAEVEGFLADHPGVREVLVVGAPHPSRDEVVIAFVVPADPALTPADLVAHAKRNIAGFKVPWLVTLVEDLPRTGTGKLTRRALRDRAAELVAAELAVSR
ncbi:class I adenylate-forming enzyme family protein [Pseudonocardia endophytica]|uniref:Fatty-acyl-CoA synthase n=1 Tax=Pseudonocardia endophytica TaxID=401976 RepID=A0A4R1HSQ0_PSEEN|nr:class I adenylate-forming enzyme family protein [Pseudonocardia endophytica]TCK25198.1 fatty-acyl-CoA synthase [Pseudonocardia endophytica]